MPTALKQTISKTPPDDPRARLKAAIAESAAAEKDLKQLEVAVIQAERMVEDAEEAVEKHKDTDRLVTEARVNALKAGRDGRSLPAAVAEKLKNKKAAAEELEQSIATFDALKLQAKLVRDKRLMIKDHLHAHAVAVLAPRVEDLAAELTALEKRRWALVDLLRGFYFVRQFSSAGTLAVIDKAFRSYVPGEFTLGIDPAVEMAKRWDLLAERLIKDPDAAVELPANVLPSDFLPKSKAS